MTDQYLSSRPSSPAPHRLLFLHGLFRKTYPHSGRTVAGLLARGLDNAVVSPAPDLLLDDGGRCPRYLVQPESDSAAWRAVEVVEVVYDDIVKESYDRLSLVRRALIGLWMLCTDLPRLMRLILPGHPRVTARQVGMVVAMGFVHVAMFVLTLVVLALIVDGAYGYVIAILQKSGILGLQPTASGTEGEGAATPDHLTGSIAILALFAVAGKLFISKSFSEVREDAASAMFAAITYQKPTSRLRRVLLERVGSALRSDARLKDDRSLSILAFSQGTLLTIDALFPTEPVAEQEAVSRPRIDLLVTLGCPLAVAKRLWPARLTRPERRQAEVRRWINFYEAHDQLGGSIAELIRAEAVVAEVEDREFSYADPAGRPSALPHISYWLDGPMDQLPSATQIATELVRGS